MTTIGGLPAHILLVHAVVVLLPLAALLLVAAVLWPRVRQRVAPAGAAVAVVGAVLVPVTTDAGEWLERRVPENALVRAHTELGDTLLPWAIGLAVVGLLVATWDLWSTRLPGRREAGPLRVRSVPAVVLAVLVLVAAVGTTVQVYRIGDSGARAVWDGRFSQQATSGPTGPPPS